MVARSGAPTLRNMRCTWFLTVCSERFNWAASSLLEKPWRINCASCRWRGLKSWFFCKPRPGRRNSALATKRNSETDSEGGQTGFSACYTSNRTPYLGRRSVGEDVPQNAFPHHAEENAFVRFHADHHHSDFGSRLKQATDNSVVTQRLRNRIEDNDLRVRGKNLVEDLRGVGATADDTDVVLFREQADESFAQQPVFSQQKNRNDIFGRLSAFQ